MAFGFTGFAQRSNQNRKSLSRRQAELRKKASRKLLFEGLEDRRVLAGFVSGSINGQDDWSGGTGPINTSVYQAIDQSGLNAHTGVGSWQISNNTSNGNSNGAFTGWPFTPGLVVSAGQPSSGATANRFSATFYFKSGSAIADGSNVEIDLGTVAGDDRNTFMAITNRADVDGGLQIRMAEPDGVTGDFFNTQIVSTGLSRTAWHRIDITAVFVDGAGNDTFQVSIDGNLLVNPNAASPNFNTPNWGTFEGYRNGLGSPYAQSNRLFFRSGAAASSYGVFDDNASQGIFVDDLSYRTYNSANPSVALSSYAAAFEAQPTNTYVDQDADFSITTDNGTAGVLDAGDIVTWNGPTTVTGLVFGTDAFTTVQGGVSGVAAGGNVYVAAGTYVEDVTVGKTLHLLGAGPGASVLSGAIGGPGATIQIGASDVEVAGFTITREGNNPTDWTSALNFAGIAIQGQANGNALIHDNLITANRTGIDVNNSNGNVIRNNVISNNRTGLIFRNQTDNQLVTENAITGNYTVGIVFLDASSGTNSPVQSAIGSVFTNNNISGNWYGQIVDRQTGGALPAPGANVKNFSGNWFGTASPVISTANSAEPGGNSPFPAMFGGTDVAPAPGTYADILGPASANFDVSPWLNTGVDTNPLAYGFQGDFSSITVTAQGAQVGSIGRIQEGINLSANGALMSTSRIVKVEAGTYTANNLTVNKPLTLLGANAGIAGSGVRGAESIVLPSGNQNALFNITSSGVWIDGFLMDGDDTSLSNVLLKSGADTNAAYGVRANGSYSSTLVQNNIIKNVSIGFRGDGWALGNTITNNWFDSVGNFDFGYAVSLRCNYYADITNNKMTRVWTGIHLNNFNGPIGPLNWSVTNNEIHAYAGGLLYWLQYNGATSLTASGNQISAEAGAVANNFGILMVSIQDAVNPSFTNNSVTGNDYGIGMFNVSTSNFITLGSTNSVIGSKVSGVLLTNNLNFNPIGTTNFLAGGPGAASTVNINALPITIAAGGTGITVDSTGGSATTLALNAGATISGGLMGLTLKGAGAALAGNTLSNVAFTGQTGNYVNLLNGALDNVEINGISATFDGLTGATATLVQNFGIENKLIHAIDDSTLGFIRVDSGDVYVTQSSGSVQRGVDAAIANDTVHVDAGTFIEDVSISKTLKLLGAGPGSGPGTTTISGAIGGSGSTVQIGASNVEIAGFTITREGNNLGQWNDPNLNLGGITIQGQAITAALIHDNLITGNRTGIDINNSNGHTIRNNVISDNRTGLLFRNQTDNLQVSENAITNNFTVGILFLDGSGGTNSPVQSAVGGVFTGNNISGNWYGQIVDRQVGGSLPAPGTNLKDFSGNWFGSATPSFSTANSAEPGYAAQIPVIFGGSATAPGGQPDILGPASANFDVSPWLATGVDTNLAVYGFQGDYSSLVVSTQGAQVSSTGRITEGYNLLAATGTLAVRSGTYTENVDFGAGSDKGVTLALGASPGQVIVNGNFTLTANDSLPIEINGTNPLTDFDNLVVSGDVALGGATLTLTGPYVVGPIDTFTIVNNGGSNPVGGLFNGLAEGSLVSLGGQQLFITYQGGDGNDIVLNASPTVNGTAGADTLVFTPTATGYTYQLNGGPVVVVNGNPAFTFNGLDGDDLMIVNLNTFALPTNGVFFNGGSQDVPGANPNFGDVLKVVGSGTQTATYQPNGVVNPLVDNDGQVSISGQGVIHFTQLEPVDLTGFAVVNVNFANANDAISLSSGFDAGTGLIPALIVAGTSGLVPFEQVHLWNNAQVNIDTVAGGSDGNDTVTINGGNNAHGNSNVDIKTGNLADTVSVTGSLTVSGLLSVSSQTIAFSGGQLSAANVAITSASVTDANATLDIIASSSLVMTATSGIGAGNALETQTPALEASTTTSGIFLSNTGDLTVGGVSGAISGLFAGSGNIVLSTSGTLLNIEGIVASSGNVDLTTVDAAGTQNLTVGAAISASGTVKLAAGDDLTVNATINASQVNGFVDFGNSDVGGGQAFILAAITSTSGTNLTGDSEDDTFTLNPQTTTSFAVDGQAPTGTLTGDKLVMTVPAGSTQTVTNLGSGNWTFPGGLLPVSYTSIEENAITGGPINLVIDLDSSFSGDDNYRVSLTPGGTNLLVERTGVGAPIGAIYQGTLSTINSLSILGDAQNDSLLVDDVNGLPHFLGSVAKPFSDNNANVTGTPLFLFDGGAGTNTVAFQLIQPSSQTYGIGKGDGTNFSEGEVFTDGTNPADLGLYFKGVSQVQTAGTPGGSLTIFGDTLGNSINISPSGASTLIAAAGYASFLFTGNNFSSLLVDGLGGGDTLDLVGFGSSQTNSPAITLDGNSGDDSLIVRSTSGNTGAISLYGQQGNDTFTLGTGVSASDTAGAIAGSVTIDGGPAASNDRLFVSGLGNLAGATATLTSTTLDGLTGAAGTDVTFSNINLVDVTGTNLVDTLTTTLTAPSVNNDLAVVNVHGGGDNDQFYLHVPATPTNTPAGLTNVNLYGDAGNDSFGSDADRIIPAYSKASGADIFINGGTPDVPNFDPITKNSNDGDKLGDRIYVDVSSTTGPVIVDTVSGIVDSASHRRLVYNGMEDIDLYDNAGQLQNVHQGALYMRATEASDYLVLMGLAGGKVRIRANNGYYGDYAPTTKLVIHARGGNDYIATSAMPANLPLELYGDEGDDSITGSAANDLIVGGEGLDRISGGAGGADEIWGDVFNPVTSDPNLDIMLDPTNPLAIAIRTAQVDKSIYNSLGGPAANPSTDGNDVITTSAGNGADRIYGQGGNDIVTGSAQDDVIYGGDGIDNLSGANGNDRIYGGAGNDNLAGEGGDDFLFGGDGNDTLNGGLGNDVLVGGTGQDILRGDQNRDMVIGGLVSYSGVNSGTANSKAFGDANDVAMLELLNNWRVAVAPSIPFTGLTVTNDGEIDSLSGGDSADDFYNEAVDLLIDYLLATGDRKTL